MADNLTTFMCPLFRNLGASTFCNTQSLSRPYRVCFTFLILDKNFLTKFSVLSFSKRCETNLSVAQKNSVTFDFCSQAI